MNRSQNVSPAVSLEAFYSGWSSKDGAAIEADVAAAARKADAILAGTARETLAANDCWVEVGCGYGGFLAAMRKRLDIKSVHGFDFSAAAIEFAQSRFAGPGMAFYRCASLDAQETADLVRQHTAGRVDCIALIDVLEHIPDALGFVRALASVCPRFLIKLPVESTVFDNYCAPKEYPGSRHSNGHLREFDAHSVFHFVRQLGLTPVHEGLYVYAMEDAFPLPAPGTSLRGRTFRGGVMAFKRMAALLLPKKWFLRLVGGGGYYCVAHFNEAHVLRP